MHARRRKTLAQAREQWRYWDQKGGGSPPVLAASTVPVPAAGVIKARDVDATALDEPVVCGNDASHGAQKDGVAAHKGEERLS